MRCVCVWERVCTSVHAPAVYIYAAPLSLLFFYSFSPSRSPSSSNYLVHHEPRINRTHSYGVKRKMPMKEMHICTFSKFCVWSRISFFFFLVCNFFLRTPGTKTASIKKFNTQCYVYMRTCICVCVCTYVWVYFLCTLIYALPELDVSDVTVKKKNHIEEWNFYRTRDTGKKPMMDAPALLFSCLLVCFL